MPTPREKCANRSSRPAPGAASRVFEGARDLHAYSTVLYTVKNGSKLYKNGSNYMPMDESHCLIKSYMHSSFCWGFFSGAVASSSLRSKAARSHGMDTAVVDAWSEQIISAAACVFEHSAPTIGKTAQRAELGLAGRLDAEVGLIERLDRGEETGESNDRVAPGGRGEATAGVDCAGAGISKLCIALYSICSSNSRFANRSLWTRIASSAAILAASRSRRSLSRRSALAASSASRAFFRLMNPDTSCSKMFSIRRPVTSTCGNTGVGPR